MKIFCEFKKERMEGPNEVIFSILEKNNEILVLFCERAFSLCAGLHNSSSGELTSTMIQIYFINNKLLK